MMSLSILAAIPLGALCGWLLGYAACWPIRRFVRWLSGRYPRSPIAPPAPPPLLPLAPTMFFGGPWDGLTTTTATSATPRYVGGFYRFDEARNAYVWHERRLPAVDWSDLERDN